jgi:hypothetical protein
MKLHKELLAAVPVLCLNHEVVEVQHVSISAPRAHIGM